MTEKSTDELIEDVRSRGYFVTKNPNRYDRRDMVQMVSELKAGPIQLGAYRVRDPESGEWSKIQFHMTYNNYVMAKLEESSATLFCRFIQDQLDREKFADTTPSR